MLASENIFRIPVACGVDSGQIFLHHAGMNRTSIQIIEAFGGRWVLAKLTGANATAVTQWRRIGIPAKYWPALMAAAPFHDVGGLSFPELQATKPSIQSPIPPASTSPRKEAA